jgi:hypothetical protein
MTGYAVWQYAHILLFVYWLGADLGVFHAARYVSRSDLPLQERLRFLELLLKIDMAPRTALVSIIPVGFTLAAQAGLAPFAAGWLPAIWLASIAWLGLTWFLHLNPRHARAAALVRFDQFVRIGVVVAFVTTGTLTLAGHGPLLTGWLGAKFVLFGGVIVAGLLLRLTIREWVRGFAELRTPDGVDAGNARVLAAAARARIYAYVLWALVAAIAFLGVVKPTLA